MNRMTELSAHGQSCWMDDLTRRMITSGELAQRVEQGLRGITSNPAIFEKAMAEGTDYDSDIARAAAAGHSTQEIYEDLITTDVRNACDILRPVYDQSVGADGFVSLEVSPHLAHATQASIDEARRLWALVDRPNLFIKIPGTAAGVPAIEQLLFEGININITLLFSIAGYEAVADAYMRALERRLDAGQPIASVASVASFFLSRIDVLVDELLQHRTVPDAGAGDGFNPEQLLGRAANANAKLAYQRFKRTLASDRWKALADKGARVQRMLWASTSTKNPVYHDLMYVEPLIGPFTVNTMPKKTIAALLDHGMIKETVEHGIDEAKEVMADLERAGVKFDQVTAQLENEGVEKFIRPFDSLMRQLAAKRDQHLEPVDLQSLEDMARKLRHLVIRMTTEAGSGHPTSCMSCADLLAALFFHEMRWDPSDPTAPNVDKFVLSKGHAAPILWAALYEAGAIAEDPMSLRRIDSTLEGHPTPLNPWVQVATGSLGQGLSAANGMAAANRLDKIDARIYCLLGDGECSEGSVWEAAQFAALNGLSNLVAIVDVNGLGQSGPAPYHHDTGVLARRFAAFGWRTLEVDGHNMASIVGALHSAREGGPTAIIARTVKGKGVSVLEGASGWHGKPLDFEHMQAALAELGDTGIGLRVESRRSGQYSPAQAPATSRRIKVQYRPGEQVATRQAYGKALEKLGALMPDIVALDGDVVNSTGAEGFAKKFPERFFQSFIAEQNMVGTALGLAASGKVPYAATFACFLTRAYDFIRMAQYSRPRHLVLCGSHAGVSIGEDGPSQMGLEDIAMFRALIDSIVLYPSDAVSAERLTEAAAHAEGIVYIRTTRPKTAVIYPNDEDFPIGGSKTLHSSNEDRLTIVAAGITLHEALAAHDSLERKGIRTRIIDAYSVKPIDKETLTAAARETARVLVVEDHAVDGGLADAVSAAVGSAAAVHRLGIVKLPRSGKKEELLDRHSISRRSIEQKALEIAD
ncbi:transketolase [Sinorhizobium numidicum]|uniref:Transaldolase n=1 Tax=Sinorhizobium numidicum TaxID=680248 RepID=A0ABY8CNB3_9HYPH|nr:transketolase [Sinorhizobium numidicum]WEX74163.1 transketolase [Sinorhizobium numidicum]WEX80148.1 transketolase [Sinorhizobium numidicum]